MINSEYLKNKTARNTFFLYSAVIINIFLGWAIAKLNTNYLTIDEFGQYTLFLAVIYFILPFFTFGIFESNSRLLALNDDEQEKREYFGAAFLSVIIQSIPFIFFLAIFSFFSDSIFEVKIGKILWNNFVFIGFILFQSYLLLSLRGAGKIKILSFLTFSPRLIYLILLGYLIYINQYTLLNSIYFLFTGLIVTVLVILIIIKPSFKNLRIRFIDIYSETKQYGKHLYFSNIMGETLSHSDKILISYFMQPESIAYYGLAYMLTFPLSHFSKSLATTLFSKFANEDYINSKILKTNFLFISITVFIFILFRKYIIVYLFSENYMPAVELMLPLALAFGFSGLSKPFTHFLMAKGFGKIVRNISIAVPVSNILLNLVLIPKYGIKGAAWAAFCAFALDLSLYCYFYKMKLKK